ncbi:phosphoadenylyl-sulfate reductase [Leptothoe kymatousa]|uniref:Adenosine 5'-phosphosulfate reductase n=1 Tax=Leptothoe kymatousa TAU-MAC 1615 TaxID=2364775 RepID=A0ABS5Y4A4_9CYAN|nr:phosphoadenylyl-sulfate reductase [Leptothoe kymatousa]MBT9312675.1 phosphoadenylyl-sulfate reductase [Leptothoe kymatousa TAU-MAC 1615]
MVQTPIKSKSLDIEALQAKYVDKSPMQILEFALEQFDNISLSFSGAEDVVLIDMATKIKSDIQVFTIDTGRLHKETYQFLDQVREKYKIDLEVLFPDTEKVETLVREKGLFSFYKDGHKECCAIRKVDSLRRKLATAEAWITGQRKDQSPDTRASIPVIQADTAFSTADNQLIKFNPLASWSSAQVWKYIRFNKVPYNSLHQQGFISIGCEPCTMAVLPSQHEREGRWWWENSADKECGFHSINSKPGT